MIQYQNSTLDLHSQTIWYLIVLSFWKIPRSLAQGTKTSRETVSWLWHITDHSTRGNSFPKPFYVHRIRKMMILVKQPLFQRANRGRIIQPYAVQTWKGSMVWNRCNNQSSKDRDLPTEKKSFSLVSTNSVKSGQKRALSGSGCI